jgi:CBS-domain-containing membrane protein
MWTTAVPTTKQNPVEDLLDSLTAADLMTPNPVSLRGEASVADATVLFTDRAFNGAAVIDDTGRPIGVLSSTDLLIHDREKLNCGAAWSNEYSDEELSDRVERECMGSGYQVVEVDRATVSSIMTPVVFSVTPRCTARKVMEELVSLQVHRLFVLDESGTLVGVISALDVVRGILKEAHAHSSSSHTVR